MTMDGKSVHSNDSVTSHKDIDTRSLKSATQLGGTAAGGVHNLAKDYSTISQGSASLSVAKNSKGKVVESRGGSSVNGGSGTAAGQIKQRKHRRMAIEIKKEFKCLYCDKFYGSEAAAIMHMRTKHMEGTKAEIEQRTGKSLNSELRRQKRDQKQ